jgi:hypothetical protein
VFLWHFILGGSYVVLNKALDIVLKDVKNFISWEKFYNELCKLLGDGFDGRIAFYENIDEYMSDRGFEYDEHKNRYFKNQLTEAVKEEWKPLKGQQDLFKEEL